jgi:hypothetical protein
MKFIAFWDVRPRILADDPWSEINRRYETLVQLMRWCWLIGKGRRSTDYNLTQSGIDYIATEWHAGLLSGMD